MQGDFTRFTHDPGKRYIGVLRQQGRLDLDADANEHFAIRERLARLTRVDVIGANGAPQAGGGFAIGISADGADLTIEPGRIYVGGALCELDAPGATYAHQPYWLTPDALVAPDDTDVDGRIDLVYLDVWQRHVSAVEDPDLLDPALNGLDTTTRLQTLWQVRVLKGTGDVSCADVAAFPPPPSGGRLTVAATAAPSEADPCDMVVAGGYRGVENRLYRVEIHEGGALGAATWKWSRDNGSILLAVEEFLAAPASQLRLNSLGRDAVLTLRQDDWVEILDDVAELDGEPGLTARVAAVNPATRVVTLDRDVPAGAYDVARHARVRRWDQVLNVDAEGLLATGAGPFDLEDGITVSFAGADFRAGDWWAFAARTAGGTVAERTAAPPDGIVHAYAPLARIQWSGAGDGTFTAVVVEHCRETFPPLNDLCAEDICFENDQCQLNGATTVQEALDLLCVERDLRFHNKHLHGWGIVCGLQVQCGPDADDGTRRNVTIRPGYAIDCEGNDLLLRDDEDRRVVDLLARIGEWDEEHPDTPILDAAGNGEVCLVLAGAGPEVNGGGNGDGGPRVVIEPLGPLPSGTRRVLDGTIWMDVYEDCIESLLEFLKDEFAPDPDDPDEQGQLVGPAQRRLTTVGNLLVQLVNPSNGRLVYLSAKEDAILRDFYHGLRFGRDDGEHPWEGLQSKTFCAMFANARPFPEYPFSGTRVSTAFGKGFQTRLRVDSARARGYTVGGGGRIHVYDLATEEMIADLAFPGGEGVLVRDVAVSEDGKRLFTIGRLNADTIFAVADIVGAEYRFRPVTVICDLDLTTLAVVPGIRNVYAVGRGTGLYEINPEAVQERPQPLAAFNAVGHLIVPAAGGPAWATAAAAGASATRYDRVLRLSLDGATIVTYPLADLTGGARSGSDDIAVLATQDGAGSRLYAVVDGAARSASKQLLVYDANPGAAAPAGPLAAVAVENTQIALALVPDFLVMAFEDSYRLGLLNPKDNQVVTLPGSTAVYRHPVQISPGSLAVEGKGKRAWVLNSVSNTLNVVPFEHLRPEGQLDLGRLAEYRDGVLEAFTDLLGGFLQYLKDCFCDHLLLACPTCDEDQRIYLACASVREGEVYQVCNFSKRRYVKTFPGVEYWMSIVPIVPLIREAVRTACCAILPDIFGKFEAPQGSVTDNLAVDSNRVRAAPMRQGVTVARNLKSESLWRDVGSRFNVVKGLGLDWLGTAGTKPAAGISPEPRTNQVVGQRVAVAQQELERAGVTVAAVEPYDPAKGGTNLLSFASTGGRIPRGQPVTLFEKDGVVKYYTVAAAPAPEVTDLRRGLEATRTQVESAREELTSLRAELSEARRASGEALASREAEIASLRSTSERMAAELADLRGLRAEVDRIRGERPR